MLNISKYGILWRQLIHKPLVTLFRSALKRKVRLISDESSPTNRPTIYAATHVFYDDIASVCCCLPNSAWLLYGEYEDERIPATEKMGLFLNGVITVKREDKVSRANSLITLTNILKKKGHVLIFPEGAWNLTPNLPVQKIWWGLLESAHKADAIIVPVAVDVIDDQYSVIIGKNFDYKEHSNKKEAVSALRDELATLVWKLFEIKPPMKRAEVTDELWLSHCRTELARVPWYDLLLEESCVFRPKGEMRLGEVLAQMYGFDYRSMANDYEEYRRVEKLISDWTKPLEAIHGKS